MSLYSKPAGAELFTDDRLFNLEFGKTLPRLEIAFETWGELNKGGDNAVLICPAFSAHSHARSHKRDEGPGWWEEMIGPGKAFDTDRFYVICASLLGGCYGTTGPPSTDPETGEPYKGSFPEISIRDIVDVHMRLVDHLGIDSLCAAVGGSMGGMQSLELGVRYPERVRHVITISSTLKTQAFTAMLHHIGRRAIMGDEYFQKGFYDETEPAAGLKLAREIGTIFYRSREEFNQRFSCTLLNGSPRLDDINFDFQSYLNYQSDKILGVFDANSYLRLSLAMDLHDVTRGFPSADDALSRVEAALLVMGVPEDRLIPIDEQREIHDKLLSLDKNSTWRELPSPVGHDAFLKEFDDLTPLVAEFLKV